MGLFHGQDNAAYVFPPVLAGSTNTLNHTMIFYCKPIFGNDDSVGKSRRWYVQVRE